MPANTAKSSAPCLPFQVVFRVKPHTKVSAALAGAPACETAAETASLQSARVRRLMLLPHLAPAPPQRVRLLHSLSAPSARASRTAPAHPRFAFELQFDKILNAFCSKKSVDPAQGALGRPAACPGDQSPYLPSHTDAALPLATLACCPLATVHHLLSTTHLEWHACSPCRGLCVHLLLLQCVCACGLGAGRVATLYLVACPPPPLPHSAVCV